LDLPALLKSLLGLRLGQKLLELLLGELRLGLGRAGTHRLRGPERLLLLLEELGVLSKVLLLLLRLLEKLLLLLLREELLGLLRLLGGKLLRLLLREKMSRERINLTVLVVIAGESFQRNLFSGQLSHGDLSRLLRSLRGELLGLRGELLLRSELLLLLRSLLELEGWVGLLRLRGELPGLLELLGVLGELLVLLELLGVLSELLVLLELSLELVWLLLLLLEVPEVLLEVASVELLRGGAVGVEVGSVEDWPPGALSGVGEVLSLGGGVVLLSNLLLFLHHGLLESNHSLVSLLLQLESRVGLLRGGLCLSERVDLGELQV